MAQNAKRLFEKNQRDLEALADDHTEALAENTRLENAIDALKKKQEKEISERDARLR